MQKSIASIVSLLLLGAVQSMGCGPFYASPTNIYLYRFLPRVNGEIETGSNTTDFTYMPVRSYLNAPGDNRQANIALWLRQTSTKLRAEDVEQTVYGHTLEQLEEHLQGGKPCNAFERWLLRQTMRDAQGQARNEYVDLLLVAKTCEENRAAMADAWYYPYEGDRYHEALRKCKAQLSGHERSPLFNRWVLQTVRTLAAMGEYEECVAFWNKVKGRQTGDIVWQMAEQKMASALHHLGRNEEAAAIYMRYGDIPSLLMCGEYGDRIALMETVYEQTPDAPFFREELQYQLLHYDNRQIANDRNLLHQEWCLEEDVKADMERGERLLAFCRRVVKERRAKRLDMWCFAAAAMSDTFDKSEQALDYIRKGLACCHDAFLRDALQILRMYCEARSSAFTPQYEQRLYRDLKWLDRQLVNHVDKKKLQELYSYLPSYSENPNCYYYNDAMRRIVHEVVVPAALKAGRTTRALQLANYADNRLFLLADIDPRFTSWGGEDRFNHHDFSNEMFQLLDSLKASDVEQYCRTMHRGRTDSFGRFLNTRGKTDTSYWCDITGTLYLRDMQYAKAEEQLRNVPKAYEKELNVETYLKRDPFNYETWKNRPLKENGENSKLRFAREMHRLERVINAKGDENARGEAMIRYAVGLKNSFGECWAMTRYKDGCYMWWDMKPIFEQTPLTGGPSPKTVSRFLIEKGLNTITNPERKARQLHLLARNREVMKQFPTTQTAQFLRQHCDTWKNWK